MKTFRRNVFILSFFILVMCFIPVVVFSETDSPKDSNPNVVMYKSATEFDYPPFSVTSSGKADGFSVELLKAVAEETGIQISFKIDQWAIIKEELKNGQIDILPLVSFSEERDGYYDFSVPYIVMYGNIFVQSDNTMIKGEEDLIGKRIAVMDGDTAQEYAVSKGLFDELILTTTFQDAFQLLADGECDAVLAQSLVGEKIISDMWQMTGFPE
jgi:ABC-type amino acid transport substrate-binding protein